MGRIAPTTRRRLKDHQPYYPTRVGIGVVLAAWVFGWAVSAGAFNILVTNDDGIDAEGLAVLASELSQVGNVFVVAPDQNHSGSSHSTSIVGQEFTIKRTEKDGQFFGYSVSGTPVDAVNVGVLLLHADKHFDLLLSGINHGTNVGNFAQFFWYGRCGQGRASPGHPVHCGVADSTELRGGAHSHSSKAA